MTALVMNESNIALINNLRNVAAKTSTKIDIMKFFSDDDYARSTIKQLTHSEFLPLSEMARNVYEILFGPNRRTAVASLSDRREKTLTSIERFAAIKDLMTNLAVDASGFNSFLFILKLEKCDSIDELKALLPKLRKFLLSKRGEPLAAPVIKQMEILLR
jgi:hypothetical protein